MKKNLAIQRSITLLMLVLFAFSVTPKVYLHSWIADHQDFYGQTSSTKATISQSGFQCDCQDQVVSSSYTPTVDHAMPVPPVRFAQVSTAPLSFLFLSCTGTKDPRGPPAIPA